MVASICLKNCFHEQFKELRKRSNKTLKLFEEWLLAFASKIVAVYNSKKLDRDLIKLKCLYFQEWLLAFALKTVPVYNSKN